MHAHSESGYILIYTVLAISMFVLIATGLVGGIIRDIDISDTEVAAVKASMAADAGMECVRYWHFDSGLSAFSSNSPNQVIRCDTPAGNVSFATANGSGGGDCTHKAYDFQMSFSNSSCAKVHVEVDPVDPVDTVLRTVCRIAIQSSGYDNCANPTSERVRWANK